MDDREVSKRVKEGGVLAQVSFEIIGSPKEHVEQTIRDFVANIKKDSQIHFLSEEYGEAEELDSGLFSTFVDTELLCDELDKFNWLCVNFMPASIEILAPETLKFSDKDLTNWFNDLLAKLHEVSAKYRQLLSNEESYTKNLNAMIHNSVLLAAETYHTPAKVAEKLGIPEEQVLAFLDSGVKNKKLEKKGNEYFKKKAKSG